MAILALAGGTGLTVWLAVSLLRKPPVELVDQCRRSLTAAKQVEAEYYAPALFRAADSGWDQLLAEWRRQNDKWVVARDFSRVSADAERSLDLARRAEHEARLTRDSLSGLAFRDIEPMWARIAGFRARYDVLPLSKPLHDKVAAAELSVYESQAACDRRDYQKAVQKLGQAARLIDESECEASAVVRDYLKELPVWRAWADNAVAWSRKTGEIAVVVDKMGHRCRLYRAGLLQREYPAEFGPNWLGDKVQRGDGATPEGEYHVSGKRGKGASEYWRALDIDYPNARDRRQFLDAQAKGLIASTAQLGGSIQIHGGGGKGVNWTEGCVALTNAGIEEVYGIVKMGTPVTIVGALEEFENEPQMKR